MMAINTLNTACETTLHEVYHSKIFAHHAKAGYTYPTIHFPFAFSGLIGLSTRIYQTVHDGAMAFLVVISPSGSVSENAAESSRPLYLHGEGRVFESHRAHLFFSI